MTQANYMQLLKAGKVCEDEIVSINTAQAIYIKLCKERNMPYMDFDMFVLALYKLSSIKFPLTYSKDKEVALNLLLNTHILQIKEELEEAQQLLKEGSKNELLNNKKVIKVLKIVYDYYINKDVKTGDCKNKVDSERFFKMMKYFNICPSICSKSILHSFSLFN